MLDVQGFVEVDGKVVLNLNQNVFLIFVEYVSGDVVKVLNVEVLGLILVVCYWEVLCFEEVGNMVEVDVIFSDLLIEKVWVELLDIDGGQNNLIWVLLLILLVVKIQYVLVVINDIVDVNGELLVGFLIY